MAPHRAYWTPLNVPCGIAISVFPSMRPAARAGDATVVAAMAAAVRMRILLRDRPIQDLLSGWRTPELRRMLLQLCSATDLRPVSRAGVSGSESEPRGNACPGANLDNP